MDQSAASYDALRALAGPGGVVVQFLVDPPTPPAGWTLVRGGGLSQMICLDPERAPTAPDVTGATLRRLTSGDVPAMLELTELTEPGPFRRRTFELGAFWGIFDSGQLLSMTGQRLHVPGFVEVSAVCTHPDARGRGFARVLMLQVIADIRRRGKTPFLHVLPENESAIRVYERLGFTLRRTFHLAVLKNER